MTDPSNNTIEIVGKKYPCRETQITELVTLFAPWAAAPSALVVHGSEATGKSIVVRSILSSLGVPHTIVNSQECISTRHLLEHTLASCVDAADSSATEETSHASHAPCENVLALSVHLQRILAGTPRFILVFDNIDKQREGTPMFLAALARLGETNASLTVVFLLTSAAPTAFHQQGIPHIYFPPYSREESIHILSQDVPLLNYETPKGTLKDVDVAWLWSRFCAAVWDSLAKATARDITSFRGLARRLWSPFVSAVLDGSYGPRDLSRLMIAKRGLFQSEAFLLEDTIPHMDGATQQPQIGDELSRSSKQILCAAYLASYNPGRTDPVYFMEWSERKRKRRGGGGTRGRPPKHRKIPRRHLPAATFSLPRLLAIFSAISSAPVPATARPDIMANLASLTSARLILRSGAGGINGDPLDEGARWKANIGWEYAVGLGKSIGLEMADWCDA